MSLGFGLLDERLCLKRSEIYLRLFHAAYGWNEAKACRVIICEDDGSVSL
jgi:hypothetical protein